MSPLRPWVDHEVWNWSAHTLQFQAEVRAVIVIHVGPTFSTNGTGLDQRLSRRRI